MIKVFDLIQRKTFKPSIAILGSLESKGHNS